MKSTQMKAYKVSEIVFNNKVEGNVKLQLGNKVTHNVKYSNANTCEAVLCVEVSDKDRPDVLNIKVVMNGLFEYDPKIEKEFLHVETFNELFPFAKAVVTTVSANAGIPPIIVKNVDIADREIYRFNLPKEDK